jgi:hypothetical protein
MLGEIGFFQQTLRKVCLWCMKRAFDETEEIDSVQNVCHFSKIFVNYQQAKERA